MAFLNPGGKIVALTLRVGGTLATGDGQDVVVVPCDLEIFRVHAVLDGLGGTGGNTDFVLSVGATDLWTVATGVGRIAYNASVKYQNLDRDSLASTALSAGSSLEVDIDAIPTAASTGLTIVVYGYAVND